MAKRWRRLISLATAAIGATPETLHADPVSAWQHWYDATASQIVLGGHGQWQAPYLAEAVAMGARRARNSPGTAERAQDSLALATTELKGVIATAGQMAARAIAEGRATGASRARTSAKVAACLKSIGMGRGQAIVSYMTMKAFNGAILDGLKAQGHTQVGVIPEHVERTVRDALTALFDAPRKIAQPRGKAGKFRAFAKKPSQYQIKKAVKARRALEQMGEVDVETAGDADVCIECEEIADGGPYDINTAQGLIPAHPNCRCIFVAAGDIELGDYNPYHEPAGSAKGGQFSSGPGGEGGGAKGGGDEPGKKTHAMMVNGEVVNQHYTGGYEIEKQMVGGAPVYMLKKNGVALSQNYSNEKAEEAMQAHITTEAANAATKAANAGKPIAHYTGGYSVEKTSTTKGEPIYVLKKGDETISGHDTLEAAETAMANHKLVGTMKPGDYEAATPLYHAEPEGIYYNIYKGEQKWQGPYDDKTHAESVAAALNEAEPKGVVSKMLQEEAEEKKPPTHPLTEAQNKVIEAGKMLGGASGLGWMSMSEKLELPAQLEAATDKEGNVNKKDFDGDKAQAAVESGLITPDKLKGYNEYETQQINAGAALRAKVLETKANELRWKAFIGMPETTDKEREDKLAAAVVGLRQSQGFKQWSDKAKSSVEMMLIDLQQGRAPFFGSAGYSSTWQTHAIRLAARLGLEKRAEYVKQVAENIETEGPDHEKIVKLLTASEADAPAQAELANKFNEVEVKQLREAYERSPTRMHEKAEAIREQEKIAEEQKARTAELVAKYGDTLDTKVIDVGGDEWNRGTAIRLEAEYQGAKPALEALVAKKTTGPGGGTLAHTVGEVDEDEETDTHFPESWDEVSDDQQGEIKEKFVSDNLDGEMEHQIEYWHENGEAWHDAAHQVADEHNKAQSTWVEEALDDYLKGAWNKESGEYEGGHPEIPFTADVLDQAVAFNVDHFEPWGGGVGSEAKHNVVKVEFDNKQLTEPKGYEPPYKGQGELPGIEPPPSPEEEGPKHLTEDMRKGLVDYLTEKFNDEVEHQEENVEPPDHLNESAKENLGEMWDQMDDDEKFSWGKNHTSILDPPVDPEGYTISKEVEPFTVLPKRFDPLNETSGEDYKRTQALARYLSVERAAELLVDRKLVKEVAGGPPTRDRLVAAARQDVKDIDKNLWQAWKDSSTTQGGKLLQVATADELGGRLRETPQISKAEAIRWADDKYPEIGGYNGIKAYIRGKWETTQYLLDKAEEPVVKVYRGIALSTEKDDTKVVKSVGGGRYNKVNIHIQRNGAASTSTDADVSNGWDGSDRVVLRIEAPRTAAISVPAYGINVHSEHEVVVAGTAWKHWDAWKYEAPGFDAVAVGGGLPVEDHASW